jgi:hypothetical protein
MWLPDLRIGAQIENQPGIHSIESDPALGLQLVERLRAEQRSLTCQYAVAGRKAAKVTRIRAPHTCQLRTTPPSTEVS